MSNTIIKGKIQDYERSERYDDDGYKFIAYWIKINGEKYTLSLPGKTDIYFDNQLDVVLLVNEQNVAVAGLCPKKGYSWGNTGALKNEVKETDRFELAEGIVQEKRRESFNINKGTTSTSAYYYNLRTVITYTIVLPGKNFRVVEDLGKKIKPNTDIVALLENDVAYIIKDKTNNKIYGKPRKDFIIGLVLWIAFIIAMLVVAANGQKSVFTSYNMVMVIGNLVFGIAFLVSFSAFLSASKTMKIFQQMLDQSKS